MTATRFGESVRPGAFAEEIDAMITNTSSGTRVDEIADGIYRIHTPLGADVVPGGFSFNQYLVVDDEPLLFHTGPRRTAPLVLEAIAAVMPIERLRWVGLGHFEADECGAMNDLLAAAPEAAPVCSRIAAMTSVEDTAVRPPRPLADDERLTIGKHTLRWIDAPHVPHSWENGVLFDERTATLLCGDLFTQMGADGPPVVETDLLGPSEEARRVFDYFAHARGTRATLERLAALAPRTLACMHGSAWRGDAPSLLRALADRLDAA